MPDLFGNDFAGGFDLDGPAEQRLGCCGVFCQRRRGDEIDFAFRKDQLDEASLLDVVACHRFSDVAEPRAEIRPVSYTHLTLPTSDLV